MNNNKFYKAVILVIIKYKIIINNPISTGTRIRNFLILSKFRKGAKIIRINPAKLLIKNLG